MDMCMCKKDSKGRSGVAPQHPEWSPLGRREKKGKEDSKEIHSSQNVAFYKKLETTMTEY